MDESFAATVRVTLDVAANFYLFRCIPQVFLPGLIGHEFNGVFYKYLYSAGFILSESLKTCSQTIFVGCFVDAATSQWVLTLDWQWPRNDISW